MACDRSNDEARAYHYILVVVLGICILQIWDRGHLANSLHSVIFPNLHHCPNSVYLFDITFRSLAAAQLRQVPWIFNVIKRSCSNFYFQFRGGVTKYSMYVSSGIFQTNVGKMRCSPSAVAVGWVGVRMIFIEYMGKDLCMRLKEYLIWSLPVLIAVVGVGTQRR